MAKKYWNGVILGVVMATLALLAAGSTSWLGWIDTSIITPLSDWLLGFEWMPEFLVELSWFKYLVAGLIGAIIGLYIEIR